eukprot:599362-Rhodomonas_salina.1
MSAVGNLQHSNIGLREQWIKPDVVPASLAVGRGAGGCPEEHQGYAAALCGGAARVVPACPMSARLRVGHVRLHPDM